MKHPHTLSVAQSHGGQERRGARGPGSLSAWRALQELFAGLCEPTQTTAKNPAAYPATFVNLP